MRSNKKPLYTMPGLFCDNAPDVGFKEAVDDIYGNHKFIGRFFTTPPHEWYHDHYQPFLKSLKVATDIKLRIPISDFGMSTGKTTLAYETFSLLRSAFSLADLVVFLRTSMVL